MRPGFQSACMAAKALRQDEEVLILVTLQHAHRLSLIRDVLRGSPRSWRFLIRLHPASFQRRSAIERYLKASGHPQLEFCAATSLPLYALLENVDIHVTASSTCALEALSFGVPSVIVDSIGKAYFSDDIANGTMAFADTAESVVEKISQRSKGRVDPQRARAYFADEEQTRKAITNLLGDLR